jgi:chromosome segregation ATPase
MNKVYIIVPLIALAVFGGFYMNFSKGYAAKIEAVQAKEVEEKKLKAKLEVENREKAIQAAIEAQAKRKLEREAKEKLDEDKRTARQTAEDKRERAFSDRNKLADQKRRLEKDLLEVKEEVEKIEKQRKTYVDEQAFLKNYIKQAEANVKSYYDLLDKITLAEKARAEAAAIAAAAAKKNS